MPSRGSDASAGRPVLATEPAAEATVALPPRRRGRWARWLTTAVVGVMAGVFFLYLLVPIVALLVHAPPSEIWKQMQEPDVQAALRLSFVTTTISTALAIVFGLPTAIVLARARVPGHRALETLATLPTVLPPTVAGLALLLAYGRMGLVGKHLSAFGITIPFTTTAVVMAQTFVAAPFFVNTARAGLEQLPRNYETAAYTLRASPLQAFQRIVLPLISPALLTAVGLAWARALGEFGATITFAGNFPGVTQTLPIAVYIASQSNLDKSIAVSVILLAVSFAVLLTLGLVRTWLTKRWFT
jgi:molybdate transport system permease protein